MNTVVITGANRGIGLAVARCLAEGGHRVILVCRDEGRGSEALNSLPKLPGDASHHLVLADLASLESVCEGARAIVELGYPLAALVNNAAVLPARRMLSQDGFELQLAVTHLAHFLLTDRLLPLLRSHQGTSRVVTVSSAAHHGPSFNHDDPNFSGRPYRRIRAYQQSKLANVLFTLALSRRVEGSHIEPVVLHPGTYDTGLLADYLGGLPGAGVVSRLVGRKAGQAGPILADIAVGRRNENLAGRYLDKGVLKAPAKAATRREDQEKLWAWSAAAVGTASAGGGGSVADSGP